MNGRADDTKFDPKRPYNDLQRLPPKASLETRRVLKRCVSARTAVAELRIAGQSIPDQTVLINTIPLLEARASSEVENIVTTNDALFREASLGGGEADAATKEALRYRGALYHGFQSLADRPLSTRTAIDVCSAIKGVDMQVRRTPGTALLNAATGDIVYTPPAGEDNLNALLTNWAEFANGEDDLDPLVRMAALHYQFEAIHPFTDGNGRTGRILNILVLIQAGLLDSPTLYLSRYILATRSDYYRHLQGVTIRGAWEDWIDYMIHGVEVTAKWTNAKISAMRRLIDETSRHVRSTAPKTYSHELVQLIFRQPYCRIANLVEHGIGGREAASKYLRALVAAGVLTEEKLGRDKVFTHRKYLDLLLSDHHDFAPYP